MSKNALTESQISFYQTEGYLIIPSLFDREDMQKVDGTIQEITRKAVASGNYGHILEIEPEPVNGEHVPRRIYNPFEQHETFRALATGPRLLEKITSLIGPNIDLQHSKLNMKPAKVGSVVDWHQDLAYFPHTNDDIVTTLIYLDDATKENGCLTVLPRHQHHFFSHVDVDGNFAGTITEEIDGGRFGMVESLEAPAGSVIFMHCMSPHSSLPNRSNKSRRTLIFEYRASDSFPIYYGEKVVTDEAVVRHLKGKVSGFARFGGPSPYIPKFPEGVKSLYQLQASTRKKLDEAQNETVKAIN